MMSMTFNLSRLRDEKGQRIKKPEVIRGLYLDIDKNRKAMLFDQKTLIATLTVMEFEAHAAGLFLRGTEEISAERVIYQEWFLAWGELVS